MLERRAGPREDAGFAQDEQRVLVDVDVQLVARPLLEGASPVRPDLRAYGEIAQEREGPARDGRARQVEVHAHAAAAQVPRTGCVEQRRDLRLSATPSGGRD